MIRKWVGIVNQHKLAENIKKRMLSYFCSYISRLIKSLENFLTKNVLKRKTQDLKIMKKMNWFKKLCYRINVKLITYFLKYLQNKASTKDNIDEFSITMRRFRECYRSF